MSDNYSPAATWPLVPASTEQVSKCDEKLYERLQVAFGLMMPYFEDNSLKPSASGLPALHQPWNSEEPAAAYSLDHRIDPTVLRQFLNKDIVVYIRPGRHWNNFGNHLARDLFRCWYPYRPPLPTHAFNPDSSWASRNPCNLLREQSTHTRPIPPTDAHAYFQLRQAFCVPIRYFAPETGVFPVADLIRTHTALMHLLEAELEDILPGDWSQDLIGLGGGFADGFCLHEGPMMIERERYPGENKDTRAARRLQVVGRQSWVDRGCFVDDEQASMQDDCGWQEVKGVYDEERWLTRVMGVQEAVEGVIRASGEEGRFDDKPVSDFFRTEFLEPRQISDGEAAQIRRSNADFEAELREAFKAENE